MRIRKLARELGTEDLAVLELLRQLGHEKYKDVEQQLPAMIEAQVRRHAKSLPKLAPAPVLPTPRARPAEVEEPDRAFFEREMATVKRIDTPKPAAKPKVAPPKPTPVPAPNATPAPAANATPAPAAKASSAPAANATPAPAAKASSAPAAMPSSSLPPSSGRASSSLPPSSGGGSGRGASDAEARAAAAEARAVAAEERAAEAEARAAEIQARLAVESARADAAEDRAVNAEEALERVTSGAGPVPLRAVFEARGLHGDDEIAAALRAMLDARRVGELARIPLADPAAVEELLWSRLLLLSEDEPVPPGVVAVRVPPDRSEGQGSSVNRTAMSRFATVCLLHNKKRIVIVGGSPAYHRILKEGLDQRLELRLIPGDRRGRLPDIPKADLVILWASTILDHSVSARYPEGVVVPHRSIARMLDAAAERIEGKGPVVGH